MAKYDSMRKLERNALLFDYAREHPGLSLSELADMFNISPQRVHQILQVEEKRRNALINTLSRARQSPA